MLTFRNRIYIPNQNSVKQLLLDEFHSKSYAAHPVYQKLLTTIRRSYLWPGLRKDVAKYLSKCLECELVKENHEHPIGILQSLPIPEWKWETITLDFIIGLPCTKKNHESIMVVVEKLRKTTHFVPVKSTYKTIEIADIFMREIFRLHGIPWVVISSRDVKFTSTFWKTLFAGLGTQIQFNTAYHPQIDGQTKW